jgi:hypothetical protein
MFPPLSLGSRLWPQWFDLDQLGAAPQLAPLKVERVVAK